MDVVTHTRAQIIEAMAKAYCAEIGCTLGNVAGMLRGFDEALTALESLGWGDKAVARNAALEEAASIVGQDLLAGVARAIRALKTSGQ